MPSRHTLRCLPAAQQDLLSILYYIGQDIPNRALSFVEKLDVRIGLLEQNPDLGRLPRNPQLRGSG